MDTSGNNPSHIGGWSTHKNCGIYWKLNF